MKYCLAADESEKRVNYEKLTYWKLEQKHDANKITRQHSVGGAHVARMSLECMNAARHDVANNVDVEPRNSFKFEVNTKRSQRALFVTQFFHQYAF